MKIIIKVLFLTLFISVFFAPQVQAAEENRDDWCVTSENGTCKAQKKVRKFWPGLWVFETCDGEPVRDAPDPKWCSNEVELQGISIEPVKAYFDPEDTITVNFSWKNNTSGLIAPEGKVRISGRNYDEESNLKSNSLRTLSFLSGLNNTPFKFELPKHSQNGTYTVTGFLEWKKTTYTTKPVTFQVGPPQVPPQPPPPAPAEPAGGVTLKDVWTGRDLNGDDKNSFNPDEAVGLCIFWQNETGDKVSPWVEFKVVDPSRKELKLSPDPEIWESAEKDFIRCMSWTAKGKTVGEYTLIGSLTYNGKTQELPEAKFTVIQQFASINANVDCKSSSGKKGTVQTMVRLIREDDRQEVASINTGGKSIVNFKWIPRLNEIKPNQTYVIKVDDIPGIPPAELNTGETEFRINISKGDIDNPMIFFASPLFIYPICPTSRQSSEPDQSGQGVVITKVGITDLNGNSLPSWSEGDKVKLTIWFSNSTGQEADVLFKFEIFNPREDNKVIYSETLQDKINKDNDSSRSKTAGLVPGTIEPGTYGFRGSIKYSEKDGKESSESITFEVKKSSEAGEAKKTQVATNTQAYIHGVKKGTFNERDLTDPWISVGSMTWIEGNENTCLAVPIPMELTFSKVEGGQERNISVSTTPVDVGNKLLASHPNKKTCWSYKAELPRGMDKKGIYKLTAKFPGNDSYKASENTVYVNFANTGAKVGTDTKVIMQGVQGVAVKREGDQIKLIKEGGSQETIIFTPQSYVIGGVCNQDEIPLVHFTVVKVNLDGTTEVIYDNPTYPNCEPYTFYVYEQDYFLDDIDRIEASAILPEDPESEYASSQGDITIKVSENTNKPVEAQTFVDLVSTPFRENVRFGDNVLVIAATNKAVQNPVFKVIHNGGEEWIMPATSSSNSCQFKSTTCQYSFILLQVNGDYDISFENDGVADSLSFSTQYKPVGQIASVSLLVNGEEIPLSLEGGLINLHLDGSPTNSFLIVIHYADGTELRKSLVFEYSPTPAPVTRTCPYEENPQGCPYGGTRLCTGIYKEDICVYDESGQVPPDCREACNPAPPSGGGGGGSACAYTESFNCTGQNGGCGPGSGEMRKTIINTDCSESSVSYCDGACAPPPVPLPSECEDIYYCDNGTTIHKYGYHDGNTCQYVWDDIGEPC